MGDPLSTTASILAVANLAAHSCGLLYETFQSFSKAPEDIRRNISALQSLKSIFAGIVALENDIPDPALITPDFESRLEECMLDLQAMEIFIAPFQTRCEDGKIRKTLARLRWASIDQKSKLRKHLERIEYYQRLFSLELQLLHIRLSLRSSTNLLFQKQYLHSVESQGCNGTGIHSQIPKVQPRSNDIENILPRRSFIKLLEYEFWRSLFWMGPTTVQRWFDQKCLDHSSTQAMTTGYGVAFAATTYGFYHFRIQLAICLLKNCNGPDKHYSLHCCLSLPRILSWDHNILGLASSGDVDAIKRSFSAKDATPFDVLPNGSTLLHVAVSFNHIDMVRCLIQEGAKVNAVDDFGETPLHLAISLAKDYEISRLLLDHGADLHNFNADGKTPLHTFYSPVVAEILRCHSYLVDLTERDHGGMTPLHYLVWSSKTSSEDFSQYHQRSRLRLSSITTKGVSLLHLACQRGNLDIIEYIINTAEDVSEIIGAKDITGRTPLFYATESKRAANAVTALLVYGADVGARDVYDRTALHHAAKTGRLHVVGPAIAAAQDEYTLEKLQVPDIWGVTPAGCC
ncbi:MAG: hypothetical protein Q9214_006810 [Letrouitia sp. 1 TL-2023]